MTKQRYGKGDNGQKRQGTKKIADFGLKNAGANSPADPEDYTDGCRGDPCGRPICANFSADFADYEDDLNAKNAKI